MTAAIEAIHLRKTFGPVVAVDNVDITVASGRTVALLGGNGAGKTTTISMLLGLLLPSDGQITILGHDLARARYAVQQPHRGAGAKSTSVPRAQKRME